MVSSAGTLAPSVTVFCPWLADRRPRQRPKCASWPGKRLRHRRRRARSGRWPLRMVEADRWVLRRQAGSLGLTDQGASRHVGDLGRSAAGTGGSMRCRFWLTQRDPCSVRTEAGHRGTLPPYAFGVPEHAISASADARTVPMNASSIPLGADGFPVGPVHGRRPWMRPQSLAERCRGARHRAG